MRPHYTRLVLVAILTSHTSAWTSTALRSAQSDWVEAEWTLMTAPQEPSPDLSAETVALTCARSLQWVDYPTPSAGLLRCFNFFEWECRERVTARMGGSNKDRFVEFGTLSPALQPFIGATKISIGEGTYSPTKTPARGEMVSFPFVIEGAEILSLQHPSGMSRGGVSERPPETHIVMRLQKQRRPPLQDCWLVREVLDVRHAFAGDMGNAHVGG